MRKKRVWAVCLMLLLFQACGVLSPKATVLSMESRPNIILIVMDDLDVKLGSLDYMPYVQKLLIEQGTSIESFFVNSSVCCPSRATILRGQYTHNHQVYTNDPLTGGFLAFQNTKAELSTLPVWLQAAGYNTVLFGKYLNGYPHPDDREYVPPGWSEWYSPVRGHEYIGLDYVLNENGVLQIYTPHQVNYLIDVLGKKVINFIDENAADESPFFMYIAPYQPHEPAIPAKRHSGLFLDVTAPRTLSFNEADVSDKPPFINDDPPLSKKDIGNIDALYIGRLQSLQSVDEMIATLIGILSKKGLMENTYIIFTSDNGYHLGQHRMFTGKDTVYEEDINVPFIVVGPDIPRKKNVRGYISGNVDIASTVAEWAGVIPPYDLDGRSLVSMLKGDVTNWRSAFYLESYKAVAPADEGSEFPFDIMQLSINPSGSKSPQVFNGLRTRDYLYAEYSDGFVELYDLVKDPFELDNIASSADPLLLKSLSGWLHDFSKCAGISCLEVDKRNIDIGK